MGMGNGINNVALTALGKEILSPINGYAIKFQELECKVLAAYGKPGIVLAKEIAKTTMFSHYYVIEFLARFGRPLSEVNGIFEESLKLNMSPYDILKIKVT